MVALILHMLDYWKAFTWCRKTHKGHSMTFCHSTWFCNNIDVMKTLIEGLFWWIEFITLMLLFLLVVIVVIVCCIQWDWMFGCVIATPHAIHWCLFLFSEELVELTRLIKYFMLFSWILPWVDISVDYVQQLAGALKIDFFVYEISLFIASIPLVFIML